MRIRSDAKQIMSHCVRREISTDRTLVSHTSRVQASLLGLRAALSRSASLAKAPRTHVSHAAMAKTCIQQRSSCKLAIRTSTCASLALHPFLALAHFPSRPACFQPQSAAGWRCAQVAALGARAPISAAGDLAQRDALDQQRFVGRHLSAALSVFWEKQAEC